jgi:hypothetical protein
MTLEELRLIREVLIGGNTKISDKAYATRLLDREINLKMMDPRKSEEEIKDVSKN